MSAQICDRVDSITITESVDSTGYDSPETEIPIGFGRSLDDPALSSMTEAATAVFGDAVELVADALGVELDEIRCDAEYAITTEDLDLGSWAIAANTVAGVQVIWKGIVEETTAGRLGGDSLADAVKSAVGPVDVGGWCDPERRNWHPVAFAPLFAAADRLGTARTRPRPDRTPPSH